jgi:Cu/Ag efflux protein CusF
MLVVSVGGAWADDIEGKIQSVDASDRVIVLEDGTRLWVAEGQAMDDLKEGAKVKASYEERDGKKVLTGIEVSD